MRIILTAVVAVLFVLTARAQEKDAAPKAAPAAAPAKVSWSDFFKNLKNSLSQSAVGGERKKGRSAAAVAAVRGKKQKDMADPNEPTLKGDARGAKAQKAAALDAEFEASVDLVSKGKLEEGLKGLEAFKTSHPKHRSEDVDKAIEGAKAMLAEMGAAPAAKE